MERQICLEKNNGINIPTEFPNLKEVCDVEFNLSPNSSFGFKLGISKGELSSSSILYLESIGWKIPDEFRNRRYSLNSEGNKVSRMSGNDLIKLVTDGILDFAITGADKVLEAQLQNIPVVPVQSLGFKSSRLCLEVPDSTPQTSDISSLVKSGTIIISSKLQNVTKYFIKERYGIVEAQKIITLDGSLEAMPNLLSDNNTDNSIVIDIVDSGTTALANNLKVADVITNIPGAYLITNTETLQRLRNGKEVKIWEKK